MPTDRASVTKSKTRISQLLNGASTSSISAQRSRSRPSKNRLGKGNSRLPQPQLRQQCCEEGLAFRAYLLRLYDATSVWSAAVDSHEPRPFQPALIPKRPTPH